MWVQRNERAIDKDRPSSTDCASTASPRAHEKFTCFTEPLLHRRFLAHHRGPAKTEDSQEIPAVDAALAHDCLTDWQSLSLRICDIATVYFLAAAVHDRLQGT